MIKRLRFEATTLHADECILSSKKVRKNENRENVTNAQSMAERIEMYARTLKIK